jgi:hypothetical protein
MRATSVTFYALILLTALWCESIAAQNASVSIAKRASRIPRACEGVVPASIANPLDVPALVREAFCKGAGDMLTEYTYVMTSVKRSKDRKGGMKEESTTYEVFIPILKSGTAGKGVMVITHRNGVPVTAQELEKAQLEAGKRLEKAEEKNAREKPLAPETAPDVKGMLPLGMYTRTTNNSVNWGRSSSASLTIHTFLRTCKLTFARRGQHDGRELLVFNFTPLPGAELPDNEKYVAQLTGEIWIDVQDRIVTRLVGRPASIAGNTNPSPDAPPVVSVEMQRLPEGIWLPRTIRLNGADYEKLLGGIKWDSISTFSNFRRFSTEVKDVKVNSDGKP